MMESLYVAILSLFLWNGYKYIRRARKWKKNHGHENHRSKK
jgi:hypothetical protein